MKKLKYIFVIAAISAGLAFGTNGCGNKGGKLIMITVTPSQAMIAKGTKQQFTATALFSDGTLLDWSSAATWNTSNQAAVTIGNEFGSYGTATAVLTAPTGSISTITIKATDLPNNMTGTAVLTVVDPISIAVKPANPFMAVNTGRQFKAEAVLLSSVTNTVTQNLTSHVTWTTVPGDPVATVNSSGYLRTYQTGTTEITALYSSASSTVKCSTLLTVTSSPVQAIDIQPKSPEPIPLGGTQEFTAEGIYSEPPRLNFTASVNWTSSNPDVAKFGNTPGSEGIVTAQTKTGTTTIKATDPITGLSDSITLTVVE